MVPNSVRRRAVLGAIGGGSVALTGGCLRRARSLTGWDAPQQVRFRIKTVPDDADPYALQLARTVAEWFGTAGLDTEVVPMSEQELHRQTLLRNQFELFLTRLPPRFREPDALYTLLHSRFAEDPGWQNPFGYATLDVDELLETQRRTGGTRRQDVVERLQLSVARTQPFTLLVIPDDVRAVRDDEYTNWRNVVLNSPLGYLSLERAADAADEDGRTLRIAVTDRRATMNLNPLAVEFRRNGVLTGLVYDRLGYAVDDSVAPWLADAWEFSNDGTLLARISLRDGVTWHDGESLTARDVAFTYRLLADTTLGAGTAEDDAPLPSPRYYGRQRLVSDVTVVDDTTLEIRFADVDPGVARRAFTVPVLPEHVWRDRTGTTSVAGVDVGSVTEALVTSNVPPVGSGPLQFRENTPREAVVFETFDDHFLFRADPPRTSLPGRIGTVPFDVLSVQVVGTDVTAAEMVADGAVDVTGTPVGADTVPRIGRSDDAELLVRPSDSPYILGYNTRNQHLQNPRFRRTLARLIDQEYLADAVLDGYGHPAVGPLWHTDWYPTQLEWANGNPVAAFLGSDGSVNVGRAREAFRDVGYRYDEGTLSGGRT